VNAPDVAPPTTRFRAPSSLYRHRVRGPLARIMRFLQETELQPAQSSSPCIPATAPPRPRPVARPARKTTSPSSTVRRTSRTSPRWSTARRACGAQGNRSSSARMTDGETRLDGRSRNLDRELGALQTGYGAIRFRVGRPQPAVTDTHPRRAGCPPASPAATPSLVMNRRHQITRIEPQQNPCLGREKPTRGLEGRVSRVL
jgi:hypothetical protein